MDYLGAKSVDQSPRPNDRAGLIIVWNERRRIT